ncbi:uncharacterized protein LOC123525412 [Mercenaria mercenaria]|uniref:uncharacterized protein LOC123525412 n=1 Tax=Mercenaria mercenaria TaxID=6596 RepID=UPI00234E9848|nr:uncharacterized protein LOC123525412 [Mercenaria mercenaria]XP_053393869.1 uncharacterized protein LOC123525412 [Mercenaria mercenaria]
MFWTFQLCVQVFLLTAIILGRMTLAETDPNETEMLMTEEDTPFLLIQLADGIFTYLEDSVSVLSSNIMTVIIHIDAFLQFIINSVSTIIDILIRQPANVFNYILYALTYIINFLVYIFLDTVLHTIIKGAVLFLIWLFTSLLTLIVNVVTISLLGIIHILKTIILGYLNVFTLIFAYIIIPLFESVFWALSFSAISIIILWAIFEIWQRVIVSRDTENSEGLWFVALCIPLGYVLYNIWMLLCWVILKFVCYPVIISAYSFCIGILTYLIIIFVFESCKHFAQNFDPEPVITQAGYIQTILKRAILKKLGHRVEPFEDESDKLHVLEDVNYCDRECIICFEERLLVKLFPCEHTIMCSKCTVRVLQNDDRCPVCRATISNR